MREFQRCQLEHHQHYQTIHGTFDIYKTLQGIWLTIDFICFEEFAGHLNLNIVKGPGQRVRN